MKNKELRMKEFLNELLHRSDRSFIFSEVADTCVTYYDKLGRTENSVLSFVYVFDRNTSIIKLNHLHNIKHL